MPAVPKHALFAGWAPGGRLLAYVERGGSVLVPIDQVVIARADGSLEWNVPSFPTWSPDGTRALWTSDGVLYIEDLLGQVPPIEIPASSPFGASWQALP